MALHYRHGCLSSRMNQRIRFVAIWRAWENPRFTSHWHGCRWYLWWFRSSSCCWWWDSAGTFLILWEFLHTGHKIDTSPSYTTTSSSSSIHPPADRSIVNKSMGSAAAPQPKMMMMMDKRRVINKLFTLTCVWHPSWAAEAIKSTYKHSWLQINSACRSAKAHPSIQQKQKSPCLVLCRGMGLCNV